MDGGQAESIFRLENLRECLSSGSLKFEAQTVSNKHIISGSLAFERLDGQTWEEAFRADPRFWRLRKAQRTVLLTLAKKKDKQATSTNSASKPVPTPSETPFIIPEGMSPEEATREKVRRDAELYPITTTTTSPLRDLPVHELALLEKWMVPPSRRQELREYQAELRRRAIASRDAQAASKLNSKPGERCSDPRGYWTRHHHGNPLAGNQSPSPSQAPSRRESRGPLVLGSLANKDSDSKLASRGVV